VRERRGHVVDDVLWFGETAHTDVARSEITFTGRHDEHTVGLNARHVATHTRVLPHLRVHRRRRNDRAPAHQIDRRDDIVPGAARHPIERRRRCTADEVGLGPSAELDVDHALRLGEQIRVHRISGERREGRGAYEPRGGVGHDDADVGTRADQAADDLGRFVRGDGSADGDEDTASLQHLLSMFRRGMRRNSNYLIDSSTSAGRS
jgi:hypothetical protein